MNTLHRTSQHYILIVLAAAGLAIGCKQTPTGGSNTSKVEISNDRIVVHPTVQLSSDDVRQLSSILKKYDKQLYRVETWVGGRITKVEGSATLVSELSVETAAARSAGAGNRAHKFVCPDGTCPDIRIAASAKKMMAELTPILDKYK